MIVETKRINNTYINIVDSVEENNDSRLHVHQQIELVYVKKGTGKKIIGNKIEDIEPGEIILIGPNAPHRWMIDKITHTTGCINPFNVLFIHFDPGIFSDAFYESKENMWLTQLINASGKGIKITGAAKPKIIQRLEKTNQLNQLSKLMCWLDIFNIISSSKKLEFINCETITHQPAISDRLKNLLDYVNLNYKNNITIKEMAKVANLTPESFCRFFKQKTGKKFNDYLQNARITSACQFLLTTDMTINEIAYKNGFKTTPAFNKSFKKLTGNSPSAYRKTFCSNKLNRHTTFYKL